MMLRKALPTYEFLIDRRQEITNIYYHCNQDRENIDHKLEVVLLSKEFGNILN